MAKKYVICVDEKEMKKRCVKIIKECDYQLKNVVGKLNNSEITIDEYDYIVDIFPKIKAPLFSEGTFIERFHIENGDVVIESCIEDGYDDHDQSVPVINDFRLASFPLSKIRGLASKAEVMRLFTDEECDHAQTYKKGHVNQWNSFYREITSHAHEITCDADLDNLNEWTSYYIVWNNPNSDDRIHEEIQYEVFGDDPESPIDVYDDLDEAKRCYPDCRIEKWGLNYYDWSGFVAPGEKDYGVVQEASK